MKVKCLYLLSLLALNSMLVNAQKAEVYTSSEEAKWQQTSVEVSKQKHRKRILSSPPPKIK